MGPKLGDKKPNCYNVCKGGEVKFDWQRNEKACEDDKDACPPARLGALVLTKTQRFAAHNVFAVTKEGYDTCKQNDFEFNKATYIGGWDDPNRTKPNKGTKDDNGNQRQVNSHCS